MSSSSSFRLRVKRTEVTFANNLSAEFKKNALWGEEPGLSLVADGLTAREERSPYVMLNRRNGGLEGGRRTPTAARFRPDYASSEAGKRRQATLEADRRLLPYQNLVYLHGLFDKLQKGDFDALTD